MTGTPTLSRAERLRICVVGEGMAEFVRDGSGWRSGTGGDALNIAVHLARFGHDVAFGTALGLDRYSDAVRARLSQEAIDTRLVLPDPDRQAGLYYVETDPAGERSFTYSRSDSAARRMFALPDSERLIAGASGCDVLVYSLITLAILPSGGQAALFDCARAVRSRGGTVVFDGNYRPSLWPGAAAARTARDAAIALCDIGLPTVEDEALLGSPEPDEIARRWQAGGAGEVVVKLGADGCRLPDGTRIAPPARLAPIDTSGAGDAFDAGYIDGRLCGLSPALAAVAGHSLAGWVLMRPGAAPARAPDAPYRTSHRQAVYQRD